jgi:beta-glucanase (GH16 family)
MRASRRGRASSRTAVRAAAALASIAALGVLAVAGTAPGSGAAAAATAKSSWKLSKSVDFSDTALPKGCDTYAGAYTGGASYWIPQDVAISGGLLRLKLEHRSAGGKQWTSGGLGCWSWPQTYGRFEVRAKIPRGKGIDSYLTLVPTKGGAWTGIELLSPGIDTAYVTNGYGTASDHVQMPGLYSDAFHVYVIEWAPTLTQISVDNQVIYSSPKSFRGPRWPGLVVSNGDALTGVPDASTVLPAEFDIDYLKISTYTGVAPVARPITAAASRSRPTAAPSPAATPSPSLLPTASATQTTVALPAVRSTSGDLAGGVWPWLLGGSLIAALAAATLGYPGGKRRR